MELSKEDIMKIAKEFCPQKTSECAIFVNGFVKGWEECLKYVNNGTAQT